MKPSTDDPTAGAEVLAEAPPSAGQGAWLFLLRLAGALAVPVVGFFVLRATIDYTRNQDANRGLVVVIAVVVGVGGIFMLFWAMDRAVDLLPARFREGVRPYVFVGPALVILSVFLVYPLINTILISFRDARSESFVGLANYRFVFTDEDMLRAIRNTAGWIVLVPLAAVSIGLAFATLADRLRRGEAVAKSLIFLPMAISLAGAAIVWRLVYSFRPEGFGTQIGVLNGLMVGLGRNPVPWLQQEPWNNLMLMVIMIWMQTGFAMVVLSSAIKAIPDELVEAARIDGASEMQVFRKIIVPSILPTIVVVTTYMVINAMKVFDIPFVMGSTEAYGTVVIAERMIHWFFLGANNGRGAAIAVILFVAIIPVMIWNIRQLQEQEAIR